MSFAEQMIRTSCENMTREELIDRIVEILIGEGGDE